MSQPPLFAPDCLRASIIPVPIHPCFSLPQTARYSHPATHKNKNNSMKQLERDIQKAIVQYLALRGMFHYKNITVGIKKPNGSRIPSQSVGAPDLVAVIGDKGESEGKG